MKKAFFTRRDFLSLSGGIAAAMPLTPIPWKLLDDTAKWSENWSWIPRPSRGPRTTRPSSCTLCPAGCGIEARMAGPNVIGIAPLAGHPVSQGVLCPLAFGAHQLPFVPARNTRPLRRGEPVSLDAAVNQIATRIRTGTLAIVDERPGRAISAEYERIARERGGIYIASHREANGLPLESVRTIVSFGAPVLEFGSGHFWATPGRLLPLWKKGRLAIVQIEPELSKTAALADYWLPARAGSEDSVARYLAGDISLDEAVAATGIAAERVAAATEFIRQRGPVLTVYKGVQSVDLPSNCCDVLIVDHGLAGGSLDYNALRSMLRPDGILVSLSPYNAGAAARADFVIPIPAFGESLEEAPAPWDAVIPSYALAPPLTDPPAGVVRPLDFVGRAAGDNTTSDAAIHSKVEGLWKARRGELFIFADRSTKLVTDFKSPAAFWKACAAGVCWMDRSAAATGADRAIIAGQSLSVTPPLVRNALS